MVRKAKYQTIYFLSDFLKNCCSKMSHIGTDKTTIVNIDTNFVSIVKRYYDKNKTRLYEEYFLNAGKKEGPYKSYYFCGTLEREITYVNNKKHGSAKEFHVNRTQKSEIIYDQDCMIQKHKICEVGCIECMRDQIVRI